MRFLSASLTAWAWACMLLAFALSLFAGPLVAHAAPRYTCEELYTSIEIHPNATLAVESRQVLHFEGANEGCIWYLGVPATNESIKIERVWVAPVDDGGAQLAGWTRLQMIDVDKTKQGRSPGDTVALELREASPQPWYSYSISDGMIRCWFPTAAGRYQIRVDYLVYNGVNVYRDIADFHWRYAHSSYPVDMQDVTLDLKLPMPEGAVAHEGEDVYAWGHAPDSGWFEVNENGTVLYHFDLLEAGRQADAHVIFPASWMNAMYPKSHCLFTETQKAEILQQESEWVDSGTRGQNWDFMVRILYLSLAAMVLLVGLVGVLRLGFSARSRRLLIRIAVVLLCLGLTVSLFFWEPVSERLMLALAAVMAVVALFFPKTPEAEEDEDVDALEAAGSDASAPADTPASVPAPATTERKTDNTASETEAPFDSISAEEDETCDDDER